jgi:lysyl-tRNA synthetase class 2
MDLTTEDGPVQSVVKFGRLQELNHALTVDTFKAFAKIARKGDIYTMRGNIHRTESGELSILARTLPELLSPALHQIPEALQDPEARARNRHIDMLVNPEAIQTIHVRHHIEATMQSFFNSMGFVKVTTPLISAGAGGALARPFETEATELPQEKLNLRIAPELWLKRLVVGGMDKIYEIGPAFRNEGVDATHNPEFNTCEFYQAYATLSELMDITKNLLNRLNETMRDLRGQGQLEALRVSDILLDSKIFSRDLPQHEFIPTLEEKLQRTLPDLQSDGAFQELRDIFSARSLPEPSSPTLPRLLDALAAEYLEPLSRDQPCFLTHHPACMSPLSKHFRCPRTGQTVAARAELFIDGREYANMYEEENSPFEQRRKLEDQLRQRDVDQEAMQVDESYLQALEWALPPTGGWGCGIDRLVMLFSGRERMGDVLAFGSLRNVVGLAKG